MKQITESSQKLQKQESGAEQSFETAAVESWSAWETGPSSWWEPASSGNFIPRIAGAVRASGYELVDLLPALELYKKGSDFVIVADLQAGARLELIYGHAKESRQSSPYGGPNPDFSRMTAREAFARSRRSFSETAAVFNSQFFANLQKSEVPVAFPLKKDGMIVSEGFAYPDKHRAMRLNLVWSGAKAELEPFDNDDISKFRSIAHDNALVSLSPQVNIDSRKNARIGRTYLGLAKPDSESGYGQVLVFVSPAASQDEAARVLKAFGAGKQIMLDGGGSSQMLWQGRALVNSARTVPQFLSLIAAPASKAGGGK